MGWADSQPHSGPPCIYGVPAVCTAEVLPSASGTISMTELETESLRRQDPAGLHPGLEPEEVPRPPTDLHCQTHLFCKGLPTSVGGSGRPIPG